MIHTEHQFFVTLAEVLQQLTSAFDLPCVWKKDETMEIATELPERFRIHHNAFCNTVKLCCDDNCAICRHNDEVIIVGRAARDKHHFIHTCHAGAVELILPGFSGDRYVGTLMVGPFRLPESNCRYPECQAPFAALPELSADRLEAIAALIRRLLAPVLESVGAAPNRNGDERIAEAERFLRKNFRRKIDLGELCRRVALSESHFHHLFRRETGATCGEYLETLRLEEARRLLTGTMLPIAEIARICCLIDQSRMTLLFRRRYGTTPARFRREE